MRHARLNSVRYARGYPGERPPLEEAGAATRTSQWPKAKFVVRSDRTVFSLVDLPASDTKRWIMRRKVDVVEAVNGGLITKEEACWRYALTMDEYLSWQIAVERFGADGLNARRAQRDRRAERNAEVLRSAPETTLLCNATSKADTDGLTERRQEPC